jgi:hypothetical protein
MCPNTATSDEHVPAKCFFPEESLYRKELITVRACPTHNEDTSKDDEYVRNVIAMSMGTNAVASNQFLKKVTESFKKSPKLFQRTLGINQKIKINNQETRAFRIERNRLDRVMRKIAYALYFSNFKLPWDRELNIMTQNVVNSDLSKDEFGSLISTFKPLLPPLSTNGANPKVFHYSILPARTGNNQDSVLRLVFYEGFTVWVASRPGTESCKL